jgi:hypothetical protein
MIRLASLTTSYGVNTEGGYEGWTYLSDLDIPSSNWIDGSDYLAIGTERFECVMASFDIAFKDYIFIDFGSGKGQDHRLGVLARASPDR